MTARVSDYRVSDFTALDDALIMRHAGTIGPAGVTLYAFLAIKAKYDHAGRPFPFTAEEVLDLPKDAIRAAFQRLAMEGLLTASKLEDGTVHILLHGTKNSAPPFPPGPLSPPENLSNPYPASEVREPIPVDSEPTPPPPPYGAMSPGVSTGIVRSSHDKNWGKGDTRSKISSAKVRAQLITWAQQSLGREECQLLVEAMLSDDEQAIEYTWIMFRRWKAAVGEG